MFLFCESTVIPKLKVRRLVSSRVLSKSVDYTTVSKVCASRMKETMNRGFGLKYEYTLMKIYDTSWKERLCQCMKLSEPKDANMYKEAIGNDIWAFFGSLPYSPIPQAVRHAQSFLFVSALTR
ncbi:hypothetical protein P8452_14946 [Trifolium repens]|nr:hypothetical protein P8452_14946 [Trifolium repens]